MCCYVCSQNDTPTISTPNMSTPEMSTVPKVDSHNGYCAKIATFPMNNNSRHCDIYCTYHMQFESIYEL